MTCERKEKILIKRLNGSNSVRTNKSSAAATVVIWPLFLLALYHLISLNYHHLYDPPSSSSTSNNLKQEAATYTFSPRHQQQQQQHPIGVDGISCCLENEKEREEFCASKNQRECSSSPATLLSSAYSSLLKFFNHHYTNVIHYNYHSRSSLFSSNFILLAEASSTHQTNNQQDRSGAGGIIILNSTNFSSELIQYKHPFPHIKLIDYYLSFCAICAKFKTTYARLAKEIHPWRNVIRPSAIDLGVSNNSPIAHSWSIKMVPTLRIHPPLNPSLAEKLHKQLSSLSAFMQQSELQRAIYPEHNSSQLMIHSLENVVQYMDKVTLLKTDLLHYISRYVRQNSDQIPHTWPNLLPVTETSLKDLRSNHPRQELFLLIEQGSPAQTSDSDQSSSSSGALVRPPSLALNVMLELSSSASWRAIRYVRATENSALIQDVIAQQKIASEQRDNQNNEQVEQLTHFISNKSIEGNSNNIILVYIDDSHSPNRLGNLSTMFPSMTLVTGIDLVLMDQNRLSLSEPLRNSNLKRAKRAILGQTRTARSTSDFTNLNSQIDKLSSERKIELLTQYIKHTYTETNEDREFVNAINDAPRVAFADSNEIPNEHARRLFKPMNPNNPSINQDVDFIPNDQSISLFTRFYNLFNPAQEKKKQRVSALSSTYNFGPSSDFEDKLKAIRYMLFSEIPRASFHDKSWVEQQEKLNTLVNLVSVIKAYFPFPDLSSVQFIDGVHSYLIKQQSRLSLVNNQDNQSSTGSNIVGFDTLAFKQELKRLESENRRLPEVKEWKHCSNSGYPCALWRLFHTLTAFEFKKLSQIRQPNVIKQAQQHSPPNTRQQQHSEPQQSSSSPKAQLSQSQQLLPPLQTATSLEQPQVNLSPSHDAITLKLTDSNSSTGFAPPVERLVSPPSTTTSLSLTIATPTSLHASDISSNDKHNNDKPFTEADLPLPVILVMRDYITTFYSCEECKKKFRDEASNLSLERIRHQEPTEFSVLWLWETHNRISKRLSMNPDSNSNDTPKVWFPTYEQCSTCYKKPPSFLQDTAVDQITMFQESIEWHKQEVLCYLLREYAKHPSDNYNNLFGYQVSYGLGFIMIASVFCLILILALRCTTYYVERQRRHKATLLNGNGAHYSLALQ